MFDCIRSMCVCMHTHAYASVCVCLLVCLVCRGVFISVGVFVCTVPLLQLEIRRHLLGTSVAGCQKAGEKSTEGEEGGKKYPSSPEIYLF